MIIRFSAHFNILLGFRSLLALCLVEQQGQVTRSSSGVSPSGALFEPLFGLSDQFLHCRTHPLAFGLFIEPYTKNFALLKSEKNCEAPARTSIFQWLQSSYCHGIRSDSRAVFIPLKVQNYPREEYESIITPREDYGSIITPLDEC